MCIVPIYRQYINLHSKISAEGSPTSRFEPKSVKTKQNQEKRINGQTIKVQ